MTSTIPSTDLLVVGGGAAGFFGALACAEACPDAKIVIAEKGREVLGKVKISGGGRCNVTHACFDPRELVTYYPRGSRQLIGPFHHWGPADTMDWFESRGVPLKIESDNRVFPQSDDSQSIIDCLTAAATRAGIETRLSTAAESAVPDPEGGFEISLSTGETIRSQHLLLTTGGTRSPTGGKIAANLGHDLEPAAPSLFTFKIVDSRLDGLQGVSVENARVSVPESGLDAAGPLLVTHWGLSGPAILRLSAWGARELQATDYHFEVFVNWCGGIGESEVLEHFAQLRISSPKKTILNDPQFQIPSRLWKRLIDAAADESESPPDLASLRWPHLSREFSRKLVAQLGTGRFSVQGKSMNKDEFVTCGGVTLGGVNFKTMESRCTPGLYFGGEILDIDGITGGFNFQSAWTTGRIAGEAIATSFSVNGPKGR